MTSFVKKRMLYILMDIVLVFLAFIGVSFLKGGSLNTYFLKYLNSFFIFLGIWLIISWSFNKYFFRDYNNFKKAFIPILISNFIITGTISLLMYFFQSFFYSRTIVFGTIALATVLEILFGLSYHFIRVAKVNENPTDHEYMALRAQKANGNGKNNNIDQGPFRKFPDTISNIISEECGYQALDFYQRTNSFQQNEILLLHTMSLINLKAQAKEHHRSIINLKRVNDIRYLSKFFEAANENLPLGGTFGCCVETKDLRKQRIFKKFPFLLNYFYYYFLDFPVKRVFPKFKMTSGIYFFLTKGQNRVITRAETLGRLISCGFEVQDEEYIGNLCYIKVKKTGGPSYDPDPSYGPLIRLKRIGMNGNSIKVYKMRTMYPYAEYLQDYIYKSYKLKDGGKFENDFRISTQGKIMRKLWIDELPMLINLFKGELKIIGVRPLSKHYFNLYSPELQKERVKWKPGLIPPFYADMPKTLEEIQESEMKYLNSYKKHPFKTDWKYFWKAFYNIAFRKARSQ